LCISIYYFYWTFKYKLIHNIIQTRENFRKRRNLDSPECIHWKTKENYLHIVIACTCLYIVWSTCSNTFKTCGIQHAGFKIDCFRLHIHLKKYTYINIIIDLIGLCIFKAYIISEKRTTPYAIVKFLIYELFIQIKKKIYWFYHIIQWLTVSIPMLKTYFDKSVFLNRWHYCVCIVSL